MILSRNHYEWRVPRWGLYFYALSNLTKWADEPSGGEKIETSHYPEEFLPYTPSYWTTLDDTRLKLDVDYNQYCSSKHKKRCALHWHSPIPSGSTFYMSAAVVCLSASAVRPSLADHIPGGYFWQTVCGHLVVGSIKYGNQSLCRWLPIFCQE